MDVRDREARNKTVTQIQRSVVDFAIYARHNFAATLAKDIRGRSLRAVDNLLHRVTRTER